ncbi:MAG TPA: molybdopterin-dependent oxidoreductase [Egibacteraceae bacterium]|nr:molybdopterin-dependent oxidoreductase [Egibacteraceae bacterium]
MAGTRAAAGAGALAAGAALGAGELLAGFGESVPSLVRAVGAGAVDLAPPGLKDFAVAAFGTADKPALLIGITVVSLLLGAGLGLLARGARGLAAGGFMAFGALGLVAGATAPTGTLPGALAAALAATAAGVVALLLLMRRWDAAYGSRHAGPAPGGADAARRDFFRVAGATGALALTGGAAGRWLSRAGEQVEAQRAAVALPAPASPAPPPGQGLSVRGLTPLYVPNARFYRIDTALTVPRVDIDGWRLRVGGPPGGKAREYRYDELLAMDLAEADVTLACVSNEVGDDLVGNARWLGVPLAALLTGALEERPPMPGTQVVGRSVDGFTAAFPLEALTPERTALVALGMNGEPLPARHGFPARLVVAGLYGYVSATKWLSSIELHGPEFDGYWVPRGWAKEAPVKTQSRIDVPRHGAEVAAGRVAVAGVAWAPHRGVEAVEVRVGDGEWRAARLSESIGADAWRQWVLAWDAEPGLHRLQVRATDGLGRTQTERRTPARPDGATGHHTVDVRVI